MEWADALQHVMPSVSGCPETVALDHLVKAARQFAAKSTVMRRVGYPMKAAVNKRTYPLDIDAHEELVKIIDGSIGRDPLPILDAISGAARIRRDDSRRFGYVSDKLDLIINPLPSTPGDIIITLVLKPRLSAPKVPEELEDYIEDIAHGAIASLASLPRMEWTDDKQATLHANIFSKRIMSAQMLVAGGFGSKPRRSRVSYF